MQIAVTGMGAVTPLGIGTEQYWQALIAGKCGVRSITHFDASGLPVQIAAEVHDFDPEALLPRTQSRNLAPFAQYAFAAGVEAIHDAQLNTEAIAPERVAIIMGTAMDGMAFLAQSQDALSRSASHKVSPRLVPMLLGNMPASVFGIHYGFCGPCMSVNTACSSGGDAIMLGTLLLRSAEADAVVILGGEAAISPILMASLAQAKALSRCNDNPLLSSRPFDRDRDGFVMGEGGGALVLEPLAQAQNRGVKIHALLAGIANTQDAYHITSPDPEAKGALRCMQRALHYAGLAPSDIGYINAHATATLMGDRIESKALHTLFGETIPVSSTKGATGHMMGAGGITELIACIKAIQTGILPPSINCKNLDPECNINVIQNDARQSKISSAMSNSFGFGGQNSSIIVTRAPR